MRASLIALSVLSICAGCTPDVAAPSSGSTSGGVGGAGGAAASSDASSSLASSSVSTLEASSSTGCGAGSLECGNGCVPFDDSNCGQCGLACPTGVACTTEGFCDVVDVSPFACTPSSCHLGLGVSEIFFSVGSAYGRVSYAGQALETHSLSAAPITAMAVRSDQMALVSDRFFSTDGTAATSTKFTINAGDGVSQVAWVANNPDYTGGNTGSKGVFRNSYSNQLCDVVSSGFPNAFGTSVTHYYFGVPSGAADTIYRCDFASHVVNNLNVSAPGIQSIAADDGATANVYYVEGNGAVHAFSKTTPLVEIPIDMSACEGCATAKASKLRKHGSYLFGLSGSVIWRVDVTMATLQATSVLSVETSPIADFDVIDTGVYWLTADAMVRARVLSSL